MRHFLLIMIFFSLSFRVIAQLENPVTLTIKDGLPSNVIYQCQADDKGFLWIATDQGIVRFDGKKFRTYAKAQGVPDIEVLQIVKEKNGRIWIRCYNNSVAFYAERRDRFVDVTAFGNLLHLKGIRRINANPEGGIQIDTETGSFVFDENVIFNQHVHPYTDTTFLIKKNEDGSEFRYSNHEKSDHDSVLRLYHFKGGKIIEVRSISLRGTHLITSTNNHELYVFNRQSSEFFHFSKFESSLSKIHINKVKLLHDYYLHNFTEEYLIILYRRKDFRTGKDIMEVNVYDKKTFRYLFTIDENGIVFHLFVDHQKNMWVSTIDKGLIRYKTPAEVKQCLLPPYSNINFYSVHLLDDGTLFAGNEKGEIIEIKNGMQKVHQVVTEGKIEWQRNIIYTQNKIFTFSDGGIFVNYSRELKNPIYDRHQESKAVLLLNDSTIINGSNAGLCKINTKTEKIQNLDFEQKVVLCLASIDKQTIYVGSTDGLHHYALNRQNSVKLHQTGYPIHDRVVALCTTPDSLLWVATATDGVLVLKNNKLIKQLRAIDGLASNNSLAIVSGKPQQVWLGSNTGVSRLDYSVSGENLKVNIQNISEIDGLSSNIVNQMYYHRSQLYVATEKGVCIVPDSVSVPKIKVELTGVQINQKDTILTTDYFLKANEKNITLQFSGVDLRGYFKHVDYSLDYGMTWTSLEGDVHSQGYQSGEHSIWVRAVDVNNHVGSEILKLRFDIATPIWKTSWFWLCVIVLANLGLAYAFYRRNKMKELEKRKVEMAKAHLASLEQQAFTSLMNPHFMFNALNSIQHYINHQDRQNANRYLSDFASLIRKNFEAAQQAFIPLEQEMENISLYLRLEKMRFNDKFNFEIRYDENLDPDDWMMPTMILQPLVENAILHGIMPSQIPGILILKLSLWNDDLLLEVTDNGIGIENSRALKQGSTHRSRGMELIHKRLHALSFFSKQALQLLYSVPFNDERNPGNRTSLLLPFDLYQAWKKLQATIGDE